MSLITNYTNDDNCIKFKLNNSKNLYKISYCNTIRRILISYIDCYCLDIKDITFNINNSLFNSEFLKDRLSLIPIKSNNNEKYELLQVYCEKNNETELIEDVYVSDFKIKDKTTNQELDIKKFIYEQDILFTKLQIDQKIDFEANLIKNNAFNGGSTFSPVSSCIVTFHNSNYSKEPIIDRERNYDLNSKNEPNIYEFSYENIGFFDSDELIKLALDVLLKKINNLKDKFGDFEFKNDFYFFLLKDENDTMGNLFTSYLLDNKDIEYCGYNIVHPLKNEISVKVKVNGKKDKLMKIIDDTIIELINITEKLKKEFK